MKDTKISEEDEKENVSGVKGFFNKFKSKVEDMSLDYCIKNEFEKNNPSFSVYNNAGINNLLISFHAINKIDLGYVIAFTDNDNIEGIISMDDTDKAYYIERVEDIDIDIKYKDTYYNRKGKKIYIGQIPNKVDVIRVGKNYYLKK